MNFANLTLTGLLICLVSSAAFAQKYDSLYTVQLTTTATSVPTSIQLDWLPHNETLEYYIYRKPIQEDDWGEPLVALDKSATSWIDMNIEIGKLYNYKVERLTNIRTGTGYIVSGIRVPARLKTEGVIVVLDTTAIKSNNSYFQQYLFDLENDGWHYHLIKVDRAETPPEVKAKIQAIYEQAPNQISHLVLVGHVPVPYSGAVYPDGHGPGQGNHHGAWPADTYYADQDHVWTDRSTTVTDSAEPRNNNQPGDGKFDNFSIPNSEVELGVGRIDFANLPAFDATEQALLEQYFKKNHAFRTKQFTPQYRGLIQNNFRNYREGYGQNGLKNFTPMFGTEKVAYTPYSNLNQESYIWAYAAGSGTFSGINGICKEQDLVSDSLQSVFTMHFGSYFGDWDHGQYNFLRAVLASGTVLTNCWAGRPNWFFYPMAMGETIGYCTELSMSNKYHEHYGGYFGNGIHMALMGDPTLKMYVVAPPKFFEVSKTPNQLIFNWELEEDSDVVGYYLYKKSPQKDTFELVQPQMILGNTCKVTIQTEKSKAQSEYMLKAVQLTHTASGSFYNLSAGVRTTLEENSVFPVELLRFEAYPKGENVRLNWSTASEQDNLGFEVQRSQHLKEWETIGFVKGSGTTLETQHYTFLDKELTDFQGLTLYYRLKQIDEGGTFEYSDIRAIQKISQLEWSISPNPTQDQIHIEGDDLEAYTFELFDVFGQQVAAFQGKNNTISIKHLPNGNYILIARKGHISESIRVIKQ